MTHSQVQYRGDFPSHLNRAWGWSSVSDVTEARRLSSLLFLSAVTELYSEHLCSLSAGGTVLKGTRRCLMSHDKTYRSSSKGGWGHME